MLTFLIEIEVAGHLLALVIASQQEHLLRSI